METIEVTYVNFNDGSVTSEKLRNYGGLLQAIDQVRHDNNYEILVLSAQRYLTEVMSNLT